MRGSHHVGVWSGVRRRLAAAVVGAAVALPVFAVGVAHAARPDARRVIAPVLVVRPPAPVVSRPATVPVVANPAPAVARPALPPKRVAAPAPAPNRGPGRVIYGHKLG